MRVVTVFGGANPGPADYEQAMKLGRLLGQAGCAVMTGGYIGTMEAISRGASEAGGHVIGVTCEEIEAWRPVHPNQWIKEERRFATLRERLFELIDGCQAAIALPGGPGTLAEIALSWNHLVIGENRRPLILVGVQWQELMGQFFQSFSEYIPVHQRQMLKFAATVEEAAQGAIEA
ncbi:MAG: LOG family protein [Anaerolineales bacterium]|nr:LOG family protein [Anaerolineales bacterium]